MKISSPKTVLLLVLLVCGCEKIAQTESDGRHGGGSETETLTGAVFAQKGGSLSGIHVKVFPADYDPSLAQMGPIQVASTDDSGRFAFNGLDTAGFYNIIAGAPHAQAWAYAESLNTKSEATTLTLTPAATYLILFHSESAYSVGDSGIAYFPGTDILARCDGKAATPVDSVPAGLNRLVLRSLAGWQHQAEVPARADTVHIDADPNSVSIQYRPP